MLEKESFCACLGNVFIKYSFLVYHICDILKIMEIMERSIKMNKELHTRVEEENDFLDAITGFGVGFAFFFGIVILAIVIEVLVR